MNRDALIFGYGYCASHIAYYLLKNGCKVSVTTRRLHEIEADEVRINLVYFAKDDIVSELRSNKHVIVTAPPNNDEIDPVLNNFKELLSANSSNINSITYLSTTGVYGDHKGGWVDEETPANPGIERSKLRLRAEEEWRSFCNENGVRFNIFRLSGIYGPGRSVIERLRTGKVTSIDKEGQVFCRIHVHDIAACILAVIKRTEAGQGDQVEIYNLADDLPASARELNEYAAMLLGIQAPPILAYNDAELTPMMREFYSECRRVKNDKIKHQLGIELKFPSYKEGLEEGLSQQVF